MANEVARGLQSALPYLWEYTNAAARTGASGFATTDVGKFARQLDDNSIWMLTDDSPVTWVQVNGSGLTTEQVDDRVAALVVAGTNMTITYNDGAGTLTFDAAGGSGGTTNLARYTRATAQAIANNTQTIIDYPTSVYDTGSRVTTGASWKYTANATGYYRVSASIMFANTTTWAATELAALSIYKNGSLLTVLDLRMNTTNASQTVHVHGSTTINLSNTDYIHINLYQNSGGSLNLEADATYNWVAIEQIA